MSRGGAGRGQGRKPDISPERAKLILEDCKQRALKKRTIQDRARLTSKLARRDVTWDDYDPDHELEAIELKLSYLGVVRENKGLPAKAEERIEYLRRMLEARGVDWYYERNPAYRVSRMERPIVSRCALDHTEKIPETLSEDAKYAIQLIRHNRKAAGEYYEGKPPRLYQGRQEIINAVAKSWGVSPRAVRTIWESDSDV